MPYEPVYSEDDFLNVMPIGVPITQNGIVKRVGCCVSTAKKFLAQLEAKGKVHQVSVIDSNNVNWEKIKWKTYGELRVEHDNLDTKPQDGEQHIVSRWHGDVSEHLFLILPKSHVLGQWYRLRTCGCDAILSRE